VPIVLKSGSLNLLEPSGPVQACNGIGKKKKKKKEKGHWVLVRDYLPATLLF